MAGSLVPIDQNRPADLTQAVHFGHNYPEAGPATPVRVKPDARFVRKVFNDKLEFADGDDVEFWAFKDPDDDKPFPSTPIRVRQGQVVHTTIESAINVHTIHHHGIEASTFNDGVPDTSFNVGNDYTYQWRASRAGTFFYHCHRNAPLHVQMGMFGYLVVDPPDGPGHAVRRRPGVRRRGALGHLRRRPVLADLQPRLGREGRHRQADPTQPLPSGVLHRERVDARQSLRSSKTTVRERVGQCVLLRHLTGAYYPNVVRFPAALNPVVHMSGGEPLPSAVPLPGNELGTTTAERYDIVLTPSVRGTQTVTYEFRHWLTGALAGTATAHVLVS